MPLAARLAQLASEPIQFVKLNPSSSPFSIDAPRWPGCDRGSAIRSGT